MPLLFVSVKLSLSQTPLLLTSRNTKAFDIYPSASVPPLLGTVLPGELLGDPLPEEESVDLLAPPPAKPAIAIPPKMITNGSVSLVTAGGTAEFVGSSGAVF